MNFQSIRTTITTLTFIALLFGASSAMAQANQPPVANTGGDVSVILNGASVTVQLNGSATDPEGDPIIAWGWSIDSQPNGSAATLTPNAYVQNPTLTVDTLGDYNISLVACDQFGCSLPASMTVTVVANQPPVAVATADVVTGPAPLTVNFDGSQSYDPEGGALTYNWDFGDATPSASGPTASYTYSSPGSYTVVLATVDDAGLLSFDSLLITVTSQIHNRPIVSTVSDVTVYLGEAAQLNITATDPDNDPIISWAWFIDSQPLGSTAGFAPDSLSPSVRFKGDTLGNYGLSFIACDTYQCSLPGFVTVSVVANQPPVAVATADVVTGPAPLTVNFDGSQSYDPEGGALTYDWIFGDGLASATGASAQHTYQNPGTYTVVLTTVDQNGLGGEDTILITVTSPVNNPPVASATATPNTGTAPLAVTFAANGFDPDGDGLTYAWDFGDAGSADNTSTVANPSHTYNDPGTYVAWVTVSDGNIPVSSSATIVVDDVFLPGLSFEATSVKLKTQKRGTKSRLQIKGTFAQVFPAADDVISLIFDGHEVFAAPFSSFILAGSDTEKDGHDEDGDDDDLNAYKYKLTQDNVRVEIDIYKGRIGVKAKRIDLSGIDTSSVVVELHIGDQVGVDTVSFVNHGEDHEHKRDDH